MARFAASRSSRASGTAVTKSRSRRSSRPASSRPSPPTGSPSTSNCATNTLSPSMIDVCSRVGLPALLLVLGSLALSLAPGVALASPPASEQQTPDDLVPPTLTVGPGTFVYPDALRERESPPAGRITVEYVVGID